MRRRTTKRNRSAARCLLYELRDANPDNAYPSDKMAVFEASNGQIRSARLRRGWAMLRMWQRRKAQRIAMLVGAWWHKPATLIALLRNGPEHTFCMLGHHSTRL